MKIYTSKNLSDQGGFPLKKIPPDSVFIFPTETFYAIGCLASSPHAIGRVYQLKNRPQHLPLLVLINGWKMLEQYAQPISTQHNSLLKQHWPGPLTAILPTLGNLPDNLNRGKENLAFRYTSSSIAQQLIDLVQVPIVGTSANHSGESEISNFQEAVDLFQDQVDFYIDGGKAPGGAPSTLIDLCHPTEWKMIRQGKIELP